MPVIDHEVHETTKIGTDFRYGCFSREQLSKGYYAPDRVYRPDGTFYIIQSFVEHKMSENCRSFYLWDTDSACEGCTTPKDYEYQQTMSAL